MEAWIQIALAIIGGALTGGVPSLLFARKAKKRLLVLRADNLASKAWQELYLQVRKEMVDAMERIRELEKRDDAKDIIILELKGKIMKLEAEKS